MTAGCSFHHMGGQRVSEINMKPDYYLVDAPPHPRIDSGFTKWLKSLDIGGSVVLEEDEV
jgi:hypothetical protein